MFCKHTLFLFLLFSFTIGRINAQVLDTLISKINERRVTYNLESDYTCLITTKQNIMDKHWTPKKTTVIEKQITKNRDNYSVDIIRAVEYKKGKEKDITDDVKKENAKNREKSEKEAEENRGENGEKKHELKLGLDDLIPFGEEQRNQFNFLLIPDTLVNAHRYYRIQTRAIEPSEECYEGIYWIDSDTYAITTIDLHPSKNPKFVKELQMKFWFEEIESNHWLPVQIWTRVYISLLIKKFRIQTEEVYSNYQF